MNKTPFWISLFVLFLFCLSCKKEQQAVPFVSFEGHGNEPAWVIRIFKKANHLEYNLMLDYGEVKSSGTASLSTTKKKEEYAFVLEQPNGKTMGFIRAEKCVDDAGQGFSHQIELTYKERRYSGCGTLKLANSFR